MLNSGMFSSCQETDAWTADGGGCRFLRGYHLLAGAPHHDDQVEDSSPAFLDTLIPVAPDHRAPLDLPTLVAGQPCQLLFSLT